MYLFVLVVYHENKIFNQTKEGKEYVATKLQINRRRLHRI